MTDADKELQTFRDENRQMFDPERILRSPYPATDLSRLLTDAWGKGALAGMRIERKSMEELTAKATGATV